MPEHSGTRKPRAGLVNGMFQKPEQAEAEVEAKEETPPMEPRSVRLSASDIARLNRVLEDLKAQGVSVRQSDLWRFFLLHSLELYERGELELPIVTREEKRLGVPG